MTNAGVLAGVLSEVAAAQTLRRTDKAVDQFTENDQRLLASGALGA